MLLKEVLAILNKTLKPGRQMNEKLQRWRDVYYGISLHTTGACPYFRDLAGGGIIYPAGYYGVEYQRLFDKYLLSRHPRESDATRNWRFSQYRPLTKAPFGQVTETIAGAIFQDSNYTLEVTDKLDEDFIWSTNFSGYNLTGYFANIGIRNIMEDPNGLFVRVPARPYYMHEADKLQVDIWFVNTKDIVWSSDTDLVFLREGFAWWIDKQTIWRFSYLPQKRQYYLTVEDANGYYAHMMGRLPVTIAGGEWNTQGHYDSYFSKAKAAADDFISAYSAAQLVDKEASHPFIVEASADCAECEGNGRVQQDCAECPTGSQLVSCNTCNGSGQISRNPGQHIIVPQDELQNGAPIQIINPDISINRHHRDVCNQVMSLVTEALHLHKVEEAQSGVAKALDQERLYKFISSISNDLFDKVITDTLKDIIAYRNAGAVNGKVHPAQCPFKVVKPTQFRIKTSTDLLAEYNEGTQANIPVFIRQRMALDFVDKQYSGDDVMKKKAQFITAFDSLSVSGVDELSGLKNIDAITEEDIRFSRRLPIVLDDLIREKGENWFLHVRNDELYQLVKNG